MNTEKCCLDTINYEKKRVIFLEKTRQLKARKHSELRGKDGDEFINKRVNRAVQNPDFIYEDFNHPKDRQVHYIFEYNFNNKDRYTKVVIGRRGNPLEIITAYRPNYIKERNKTKLIYEQNRQYTN